MSKVDDEAFADRTSLKKLSASKGWLQQNFSDLNEVELDALLEQSSTE